MSALSENLLLFLVTESTIELFLEELVDLNRVEPCVLAIKSRTGRSMNAFDLLSITCLTDMGLRSLLVLWIEPCFLRLLLGDSERLHRSNQLLKNCQIVHLFDLFY